MNAPEKIADNIWYHSLHVPKIGWLRTAYQGCIRATRKKLREIRPDIVHGQGTERECALGAVFSGFPNVLTIHGNMRLIAKMQHARPFSFLWLAARLETFTVPRSRRRRLHHELHARRGGRIWQKKPGWCRTRWTRRFFNVQPETNPARAPVILCVGVHLPAEKPERLHPRARSAGGRTKIPAGVSRRRFARRILTVANFLNCCARAPWCEHAGFVDREKLKTWLREATLLALPSLEDNCPMAVLEAAAAGVPVVAANVGGVPDLIEDGKTGLLCDPLNAASMSGAVEKITGTTGNCARTLATEANRCAHGTFSSGGHRAAAFGDLPRGAQHALVNRFELATNFVPRWRLGWQGQVRRGIIKCAQRFCRRLGGFCERTIRCGIFKCRARPRQVAQEQRTFARGGFLGGEAALSIALNSTKPRAAR